MKSDKKKYIHTLFETEKFLELYQAQAEVINKMLSLDNQEDFEDFLESGDSIEEDVFWLHYAAVYGESLLIGGYEEDITQKVIDFLKQELPEEIFFTIQEHLQNLYVDIDAENNLEEQIGFCNQCLADTDYLLQLKFDDTYYAGIYFLSVISKINKETKVDRNVFIENLRTTLLWEHVCSHIESINYANILLQKTSLENNITVENAFIQDSEDFYITTISESNNKIIIGFEMPFILCVNEKYSIQAVATGNLDIPDIGDYPYNKYDFLSMGKKELLSFGDIICISPIIYKHVEIIGAL